MAITKLSSGSSFTNLTKYDSFLAGNPKFVPNSYESISTVTVGSGGSSSISFSSIPSTYTHLQIRGIGLGTGFAYSYLLFNSDSASNYSYHQVVGDGTSVTSAGGSTNLIYTLQGPSDNSYVGSGIIDILDYANTNKYKTVRLLTGFEKNGSGQIFLRSGNWRSTSAITDITIYANTSFTQYSSFALYGIKGS
jgi:hypothetical protein